MRKIYSTLLISLLIACNAGADKIAESSGGDSIVLTSEKIPAEREIVNPKSVETYTETIKNLAITDEFKVRLYETKQTFRYRIKISHKQLLVEDTLRVPNFGTQPVVEIKKGDSIHPSCIIGFLDKERKFRESKLVYFKNDKIKVKVLKYYAVYQSNN